MGSASSARTSRASCVELGAAVTIVDSLVPEYGGLLYNIAGIEDRLTVNISDVRDEHSLRYLVRDQDVLFNLAGQTSHLDSMTDPYTDLEINCRSQLSILEACRHENPGVTVVFASTRQLYGRPRHLPGRREPPDRARRRERHQQGSRRVVPPALRGRLRHPHERAAADEHLRPADARRDARQTFLGIWIRHALADEEILDLRRRQPAPRSHLRRRRGRRVPARRDA